jgi:hypothetical protein
MHPQHRVRKEQESDREHSTHRKGDGGAKAPWERDRTSREEHGHVGRYAALSRKVHIRLPGKRNSNSHGARPVH